MNNATQILAAFRELALNKNISREELHDLIKDGILAALARRFGANVEAEIEINEETGRIDITVLKEVVAEVEDPSREISLEEARWDDPEFEVGDVQEVPVEFGDFGRNAVMAAKQRMLQRVREGERQKIMEEYAGRVGASQEYTMVLRWPIAPWWWAASVCFWACVPAQLFVIVAEALGKPPLEK